MSTNSDAHYESPLEAYAPGQASTGVARRLSQLLKKAASSPLLSLIDQGVISGASFATSVVIGRLCGPEALGIYALLWTVVLLLRGTQADLVTSPYMIYARRYPDSERQAYNGSIFLQQFILLLFTAVLFGGLLGLSNFGLAPTGLASCGMILLAGPAFLLREFVRRIGYARLETSRVLALDSVSAVLQLCCLGGLAWFGALSLPHVLLAVGLSCAATSLIWIVGEWQQCVILRDKVLEHWRQNWTFGKWAFGSQLVGCAATYLMPWIVIYAHGEQNAGILAACVTLVNLAGTYITGVGNYITPRAAQAFHDSGKKALLGVLKRALLLYMAVLLPFCCLSFFAGQTIAAGIYGDEYQSTGYLLFLLTLNTTISSVSIVVGNGLWAMERPAANFRADLATMGVTLLCLVTLIVPCGIMGAAMALVTGALVGTLVRAHSFRSHLRMVDNANTV